MVKGIDRNERWFAIRTRTKSEKWVIRQLQNKNIEAWVPLKTEVKKYPGRVRRTEKPMIYGYAFVRVSHQDYIHVLQTENVYDFVRFENTIPSIPDSQIELLKYVAGEIENPLITEEPIQKGDKVEVISGDLTGLRGDLVEFKGKKRVVVRLDNVGLSLLLEVPKDRLIRVLD